MRSPTRLIKALSLDIVDKSVEMASLAFRYAPAATDKADAMAIVGMPISESTSIAVQYSKQLRFI
jgi:hypothetical protein